MTLFDLDSVPKMEKPKPKKVKRVIEEELPEDDTSAQLRMLDTDVISSRTWIRYFGGKQTAVKEIVACFPDGLKEVVSPFVGGGSVELALAARGIRVKAFDKFDILVKCWNTMFEHAEAVAKIAYELYPTAPRCMRCSPDNDKTVDGVDREHCLKCMVINGEFHKIEDPILQAAWCWVANKQDWNGRFLGATGFYDHRPGMTIDEETGKDKYIKRRRIVRNALNPDKWARWQNPNITIEERDWKVSLAENPDAFVYADPPYVGNERVYGVYRTKKTHPDYEEFNHEDFAEHMIQRPNGWVMSYVNDEKGIVRSLYKDFEIIPMRWHQGSVATRGKRDSFSTKEITILKPPGINPLKKYGARNG